MVIPEQHPKPHWIQCPMKTRYLCLKQTEIYTFTHVHRDLWVLGGLIIIYTLSTAMIGLCLSPSVLCPHVGVGAFGAGHTWQRWW